MISWKFIDKSVKLMHNDKYMEKKRDLVVNKKNYQAFNISLVDHIHIPIYRLTNEQPKYDSGYIKKAESGNGVEHEKYIGSSANIVYTIQYEKNVSNGTWNEIDKCTYLILKFSIIHP